MTLKEVTTGGQTTPLGIVPYGFAMNQPIYNLAAVCKDYIEFLFEMQFMCGFFETPDGADYGEADYEEMNEVIKEITTPMDW